MIAFESLASSSSGCAYRVSAPGCAPLLIDCGIRFAELREALDFKIYELAGCLLSHAHGDHSRAAAHLMIAGVDVWASHETFETLNFKPLPHRGHIFRRVADSSGSWHLDRVGEWIIVPFQAVHDCPGTVGFTIQAPNGDRLVYLTDSLYSPFRFEEVNIFAVECNHSEAIIRENAEAGKIDRQRFHRTARTHMSLERLIDMLKANDLSKLREVHLLHLSAENSDEEAFKREVSKVTGCPVYVCAERVRS